MKFRILYFAFSALLLLASGYSLLRWGLQFSIDFTGGTRVLYSFGEKAKISDIQLLLTDNYKAAKIEQQDQGTFWIQFSGYLSQKEIEKLTKNFQKKLGGDVQVLKFETVGPAYSKELLSKTYFAIGIGVVGILLWIAFQFRSFKFGIFAILALIHDLGVLVGLFALLGHIQGVQVDILVITAFLTVLSLSVYDTIVIYDRIRELSTIRKSDSLEITANRAINDTIVRSLNTSITTILVLFALFLFISEEIRWFILALLVGLVSGTYSSPFVAVPLLVSWEEFWSRDGRFELSKLKGIF